MNDHDASADDRLLEELQHALEVADPVPDDVLAAAKASFTWRTVDAELAELQFDSAVDELAGVRGDGGERQLTFRSGDVEIEVTVHGDRARRLTGQIVPPQPASVELRSEDAAIQVDADEYGGFQITNVPDGPVLIRITLEDGTSIATEATIL